MRGISVYLDKEIETQFDYIEQMHKNGFTSIFTSLHIPEDNAATLAARLKDLGEIAKRLHMRLIADVSADAWKKIGISWSHAEEINSLGVTGLRLDYGLDEAAMIELSKKMHIALNASTISLTTLQNMKQKGLNMSQVEAWHNFYPRPETGLGLQNFREQNRQLKEEGLTIVAFIPGDAVLRGPLYNKLPTLERHRNQSPFAAFMDLKNLAQVDHVLIGDHRIGATSLAQFQAYDQGVIQLRAIADPEADPAVWKQIGQMHTNRPDAARDCVRSVESRQEAWINPALLSASNCSKRSLGTITVDNNHYGRYQGEVQITKKDLPADEKVNVLGRVIPEDRPLLEWIRGSQPFRIDWI